MKFDHQDVSNIQPEEWIEWIVSSKSTAELCKKYDTWADTYDENVSKFYSRVPVAAALMLSKNLSNKESIVLDVGAGTGLAGVALEELGFNHLIGMDLSAAMLKKAAAKEVYQSLVCCAIGDDHFKKLPKAEGIIATGVFAEAHAGALELQCLHEHIEVGGILVFTTRQSFLPVLQPILDLPQWKCIDSKLLGVYQDPMHLLAYQVNAS